MKKILLTCYSILLLDLVLLSQVSEDEITLLRKLDSTRNSTLIARHFATIYFETTARAVNVFEHDKAAAKQFIQRMETRFAAFFFNAAEAFNRKEDIPAEWKPYFTDTALSPLQYQLLGINAHVNGDIWKALTTEFSLQELKENKNAYFQFNKGIGMEYQHFYDASRWTNPTTILLNNISLGLSRAYGKTLLMKWRKRQMQLAILYYSDRGKFEKEYAKVQRKMDHINNLILHDL